MRDECTFRAFNLYAAVKRAFRGEGLPLYDPVTGGKRSVTVSEFAREIIRAGDEYCANR